MSYFTRQINFFRKFWGSHYDTKIDKEMVGHSQSFSRYIISLSTGAIGLFFTILQVVDNSSLVDHDPKGYIILFCLSILFGLIFELLNYLRVIFSKSFESSSYKLEPNTDDTEVIELRKRYDDLKLITQKTPEILEELIEINNKFIEIAIEKKQIAMYGRAQFRLSLFAYLFLFLEYLFFMLGIVFAVKFILVSI